MSLPVFRSAPSSVNLPTSATVPSSPVITRTDVADFDEAFALVIGHEGGFQNRYSDKGNWTGGRVGVGLLRGTKYGISAASYPQEDISNMTLARAKEIYQRDFWAKTMCDLLPRPIAYMLFDMAVNHGRSLGVQLLQTAIGGLAIDGQMGPKTVSAVKGCSLTLLITAITRVRKAKHNALADASSNYAEYRSGWLKRDHQVAVSAMAML